MAITYSVEIKAKAMSVIFCVISIAALIYFSIQPTIVNGKHGYDLQDFVTIIIPSLTLVSNLILLQAVLDIHHESLYYWPSPRVGFLSWIFLHLSVLLMIIYEATSCFYSIKEGNYPVATTTTKATCLNLEFYSYEATISQILVLIILGTLLLYGMKVVINVLADYK